MNCALQSVLWVVLPAAIGVAILDRLVGAWWSARVQRQQDRDGEKTSAGAGVAEKPATEREGAADQGAGDAK